MTSLIFVAWLFCDMVILAVYVMFLARLHEVHRAIVVTSVVRVYVYVYVRVTLSVKVFRSLYLLNMLMDQVDTLHVGRYWSEVLCSTIVVHPG